MKLEWIVLAIIGFFAIAFLFISSTGDHEWAGADAQAEGAIEDITGGTYQPWYSSFWEPPSGEIESLLFALQAAIGAIIIGYFLGYWRGQEKGKASAVSENS
jgi:cobalt/nickel transport protein